MKNFFKNEHVKSAIFTFLTDFSYSLLMGAATLVQTGDFTTSALISIGYTAFRTALRPIKEKFLNKESKEYKIKR